MAGDLFGLLQTAVLVLFGGAHVSIDDVHATLATLRVKRVLSFPENCALIVSIFEVSSFPESCSITVSVIRPVSASTASLLDNQRPVAITCRPHLSGVLYQRPMNTETAMSFGEHLVFVDESGDHSLTSIDEFYSVFVLAFVIIKKEDYIRQVSRDLQAFKMRHWGHDEVVLHEHEIRKPRDAFSFLMNRKRRECFLGELSDLMQTLPVTIIAVIIDKYAFAKSHSNADAYGVYDYAMELGLNGVFHFLAQLENSEGRTPVIVECRGRKEDKELELSFRRYCDNPRGHAQPLPMDIVMVPKTANSTGLQLADLMARPIGLHHLRPDQPNRAFDIIKTKLRQSDEGKIEGYGLIRTL
jgi:Protein of unknown function (DUF3800)